jgi:2-methylcitrate dehydratase PrpD
MAHLKKLPTWFVKGEERRKAFYTVQVRELIADGWKEEGAKAEPAPESKPLPEIIVEAGTDAYDDDSDKEPLGERLEEMTKVELVQWARERGEELNPYATKARIFEQCKAIEDGTFSEETAE